MESSDMSVHHYNCQSMEVLGEIEKQKTVMENKRENGDLVVLWLEKMLDSGQKLLSVLKEVNVKPQEDLPSFPNIDKNVTILADGNQMSAPNLHLCVSVNLSNIQQCVLAERFC